MRNNKQNLKFHRKDKVRYFCVVKNSGSLSSCVTAFRLLCHLRSIGHHLPVQMRWRGRKDSTYPFWLPWFPAQKLKTKQANKKTHTFPGRPTCWHFTSLDSVTCCKGMREVVFVCYFIFFHLFGLVDYQRPSEIKQANKRRFFKGQNEIKLNKMKFINMSRSLWFFLTK